MKAVPDAAMMSLEPAERVRAIAVRLAREYAGEKCDIDTVLMFARRIARFISGEKVTLRSVSADRHQQRLKDLHVWLHNIALAGGKTPTNQEIAKWMRLSHSTANAMLIELERAGVMEVVTPHATSRQFLFKDGSATACRAKPKPKLTVVAPATPGVEPGVDPDLAAAYGWRDRGVGSAAELSAAMEVPLGRARKLWMRIGESHEAAAVS